MARPQRRFEAALVEPSHSPQEFPAVTRRTVLWSAVALAVGSNASVFAQWGRGGALSKEQRDRLTACEVIEELKRGNQRFRAGQMIVRDYRDQQRTSAAGQFPAVAALGCVDSRAPAEVIFDAGIGEMFNARI